MHLEGVVLIHIYVACVNCVKCHSYLRNDTSVAKKTAASSMHLKGIVLINTCCSRMVILSHPPAALMNRTAATNDQAYIIISNHMSACYGNRSRGAEADAINIVDAGGLLTTGILHVGSASYWSTATSGLSRLSSSCITLNQTRSDCTGTVLQ